MTRQKLLQLGWEVLINPLYSPDIAPPDFHLFQSLRNSLNGKNFNSMEDCKMHLGYKMIKSLGKMELWSCLKDGRKYWNKTVNTLFNKVIGENLKNASVIFTWKLNKQECKVLQTYLRSNGMIPIKTENAHTFWLI